MSEGRLAMRGRLMSEADRLYNRGEPREAAAMLGQCIELFNDNEKTAEEWGRFCLLYGSILAESRNLKLAQQVFDSAVFVFMVNDNRDALASTYFNLGNVYAYSNNLQLAFDNYSLALSTFRDAKHETGAAQCLLSLANFFFGIGANEAAEKYLTQFQQIPSEFRQEPSMVWSFQMQQAKLYLGKRNYAAALEWSERAMAAANAMGDQGYIAQTQSLTGVLRGQTGNRTDGLVLLEQAYEEARRNESAHYVSRAHAFGEALEAAGDRERAEKVYRECLNRIELTRTQLDFGERFKLMESWSHVAQSAACLLFGAASHADAFEMSEFGQARTTLDLMFRHQIKRQGSRVIRAGFQGRAILDSPKLSEVQEDLSRSGLHLLKLYRPGRNLYVWLLKPDVPLHAWDATAAMGPLSKLLSVLLRANVLPETVNEKAGPMVEVRGGPPKGRSDWCEIEYLLKEFARALFPESVWQYLQSQSGKLVILPHREMYHIPFAAIRCDDGMHLGSKWQIAIAPSAGTFLQLDPCRNPSSRPSEKAELQSALAIGGCGEQIIDIKLVANRPEPAMHVRFRAMPMTSAEAERVVQLLGGTVLLGAQAISNVVQAHLPKHRVIHFATHGYWHPAGEISLIVLNDGVLTPSEIVELPLQAELVVLSACQTGLGIPHPDSYTGLAQTFMIGGARSVLATLWPVDDSATLFFMEHFYQKLKTSGSPALSLQHAQARVCEEADLDGYDWAPFQLIGRPFECPVPSREFEGPVFCGGDVVLTDMQPGQQLDLEMYRAVQQEPNEAIIFRKGSADKILKW